MTSPESPSIELWMLCGLILVFILTVILLALKFRKKLKLSFKFHDAVSMEFEGENHDQAPQALAQNGKVINTIRPLVSDFVERQETVDVRKLINSPRLVGIFGFGGSGKTELARKMAQEIQNYFPDAQLEFDLHGYDEASVPPQETIRRILETLEPGVKSFPRDFESLRSMYIGLLNQKRILFLFDNVSSKEQIAEILPPSTCGLILTSRNFFVLPGLEPISIGKMTKADALTLAMRIGGKKENFEKHASKYVELSNQIALAIRVSVSSLIEQRSLGIEEHLLKMEKNFLTEMSPVTNAFRGSYAMLSDSEARYFRLLSAFSDSFDHKSACCVMGLLKNEDVKELIQFGVECEGVKKGEQILASLHRRSLIEYIEGSDRYELHDVAREFALSEMGKSSKNSKNDEKRMAYQNHATYFSMKIAWLNNQYLKGGNECIDALNEFDKDRTSMEAAYAWISANVSENAAALELACIFCERGIHLLMMRLPMSTMRVWLKVQVEACEKSGKKELSAFAIGNLGLVYANEEDYDKALACYRKQLQLAAEIQSDLVKANALGNMGLAFSAKDELEEAIKCFQQVLVLAERLGNQQLVAGTSGNLGGIYNDLGKADLAKELFEKHLKIANELSDLMGQGTALGSIGSWYSQHGDFESAEDCIKKAIAIWKSLNLPVKESDSIFQLAQNYLAWGRVDDAAVFFDQAIEAAIRAKNNVVLWQSYCGKGDVCFEYGEIEDGLVYYGKALNLTQNLGRSFENSQVRWNMANCLIRCDGYRAEAITHGHEAATAMESLNPPLARKFREIMVTW